jgi:hypothetical protein
MARYLGIDAEAEAEWLWIAEEALGAPLPAGWEEHRTAEGDVYYFDTTAKVFAPPLAFTPSSHRPHTVLEPPLPLPLPL